MKNYWLTGNDIAAGFATEVSPVTIYEKEQVISIPPIEWPAFDVLLFPSYFTITVPEDFQLPPIVMTCVINDYIDSDQ